MQTKNLTPFLFAAKVTSRRPPQPEMTMIVRASFRLRPDEPLAPIEDVREQGPLTADTFADDDDDRTGACRYASDFADFKLNAEVLLAGSCHTPGARPVAECPVRLSVGAWSKSLLVVGRRVWTERLLGGAISEPHPFSVMPLTYENAFGGPAYAKNPVGKGHGTAELPNVEHAAARVRSKADQPEPAGFGPLNPAWPQRARKVGTQYGAKWRKERAPFYAEDFDWTYFHAAPLDQQLPGYLRGDEELSFVNLHPGAPRFSTRLPALRVRAFAKGHDGVVSEPRMNLDTLLVDLEREQLVLTWRGLVAVQADDLKDVRTVLVASEELAGPALPDAHYHAILDAFEADPLEIDKHVPGGGEALAALEAAAADDAAHPDRSPAEKAQAVLARDSLFAMIPADQRAGVDAALADARAAARVEGPAANDAPAGSGAGPAVGQLVAKMSDTLKGMRAEAARMNVPTAELDELQRMMEDPTTQRALAALAGVRPDELVPGADLAGRNLSRMDLAGRDLGGANLRGANLTRARLAGARLTGADLREAIVAEADLTGVDLADADLSKAMFTKTCARGANLRGARLDQAILHGVDLRGATLAGATATMVALSESDLSDADLRGCELTKAFADKAILDRADLSDSRLVGCVFPRVVARGLVLARALVTTSSFADGDLRGANLRGARGEGASFCRTDLGEADLERAVLPSSHFMEAKAAGARFRAADLRRAEFYRASLARADFESANLFGASFNKASLEGVRYVRANLYEARFLGAAGKGCDFADANLDRAMLPS